MSDAQSEDRVEVKRLGRGGYLHTIVSIFDNSGEVIHQVVKPLMVELRLRDVIQILVGASILAIPVGYTEETWQLGQRLPLPNVAALRVFFIINSLSSTTVL